MNISIIIISYNTAHIIRDCIDSILKQQGVSYEIIVVDNASQDDSVAVLKSYGDKLQLIANSDNIGFPPANNLAFKQTNGDYLFLLNPDAVLQTEYDLQNLLQFSQQHPNYGIVGCRIISPDGKEESLPCYSYPNERHIKTSFTHLPGDIAWMLGASLMSTRKIYEETSGLDENFFLYGDDVDWCLRVRQAGYSLGYNPDVVVKHVGGASEQQNTSYEKWLKKQTSLYFFYQKHYLPEDCQALIKRDFNKAKIRLLQLRLQKKWFGLSMKNENKYQRYQAIYDTSKQFLTR